MYNFSTPKKDALRELVEQEMVDKDYLIESMIRFMSDEEVGEMMNSNDIMTLDEMAEDFDDYVGGFGPNPAAWVDKYISS